MSNEQQLSTKPDKLTPIRTWRLGGPMTAAQRKEAKQAFLDYLKTDPNISAACDHAQISRDTAYTWREKDKVFADAWESAIERTKDVARSSIYRRGILGWDEPVVAQGRVALDENDNRLLVHKWSDSLASLYAKANLPEYKEKQQIEHSGSIDTNGAKEILLQRLAQLRGEDE